MATSCSAYGLVASDCSSAYATPIESRGFSERSKSTSVFSSNTPNGSSSMRAL